MMNETTTVNAATCWQCAANAHADTRTWSNTLCAEHQAETDADEARRVIARGMFERIQRGYAVEDSKGRELGGRASIMPETDNSYNLTGRWEVRVYAMRAGEMFGGGTAKVHFAADLTAARALAVTLLAKHEKSYTKNAKR